MNIEPIKEGYLSSQTEFTNYNPITDQRKPSGLISAAKSIFNDYTNTKRPDLAYKFSFGPDSIIVKMFPFFGISYTFPNRWLN
jgi:hypothetical protein